MSSFQAGRQDLMDEATNQTTRGPFNLIHYHFSTILSLSLSPQIKPPFSTITTVTNSSNLIPMGIVLSLTFYFSPSSIKRPFHLENFRNMNYSIEIKD